MNPGISKYLSFLVLALLVVPSVMAQSDSARYDRPSLCIMMVARPETAFNEEIENVFRQMDMPERFNDHSLGVRVFKVPSDGTPTLTTITTFAKQVEMAKKMVSKWFSRDKEKGCFNALLLQERGLYNATIADVDIAMQTVRGKAMLSDAGEKLISHTFLVVNEYKYQRNHSSKRSNETSGTHRLEFLLSDFTISCTSYLFRLEWNDTIANTFFTQYFYDCAHLDESKQQAYITDKTSYKLSFVGQFSDKLTLYNSDQLSTPLLVKKACIRITDRNIAMLQHSHPEFRIKAPLVSTEPLKAYIGMKEDVTPDTEFEVLEPMLHKDGTYSYKRVGVIRPIAGKIWDNRFMASDGVDSEENATCFKQIAGGELYPGLLIREMN